MKVKKTKQTHCGSPVYYDENSRMFVDSGNARVYLNGETVKKIEARKRKK